MINNGKRVPVLLCIFMGKQSRIFFKAIGFILLLLLTTRSCYPDFPNHVSAALGGASGMMYMLLFEEFK